MIAAFARLTGKEIPRRGGKLRQEKSYQRLVENPVSRTKKCGGGEKEFWGVLEKEGRMTWARSMPQRKGKSPDSEKKCLKGAMGGGEGESVARVNGQIWLHRIPAGRKKRP